MPDNSSTNNIDDDEIRRIIDLILIGRESLGNKLTYDLTQLLSELISRRQESIFPVGKLSRRIVKAIEGVLNDRKGYHIDCLPDDIRQDFLKQLRMVTLAELRKESRYERTQVKNEPI